MEKRDLHEEVLNLWEHFADDSIKVQDHILKNKILSYAPFSDSQIPKSADSLLLISRYLSWQKRWRKAYAILNNSNNQSSETTEIQLEKARLALVLGKYAQARKILLSLDGIPGRVKLEQQVYWCWYLLLTGKGDGASQKIAEIEDQYLYIPYSILRPYGPDISNMMLDKQLFRSLLRFPGDKVLFEEIILILINRRDWKRVKWLIQTQRLFYGELKNLPADYGVYINSVDLTAEHQKSVQFRGDEPPEYFEMIAQKAISDKNWELLKVISNQYIEKYPMLSDGKLYLNEYHQQRDQTNIF